MLTDRATGTGGTEGTDGAVVGATGSGFIQRTAAPVREQVVRVLRQAIIQGRFGPGERLVAPELCRWLGASRTTIREALRQLQAEGLVEDVPGRGPTVARITVEEALHLYEVREALEGLAARLFAQRGKQEDLASLEEAFRQLEAAYREGRVASMLAAKDRFYRVLFRGCGNPVLESLATTLHARITRLRSASLSWPGRATRSLDEVRAIVRAIRGRDPTGAEAACRDHVRRAAEAALQSLRRSPAATVSGGARATGTGFGMA